MLTTVDIRHFHLFSGIGAGAKGFNSGHARVGSMQARFRCLGGIDVDPAAVRDFERLAGVPGTVLDLFDREQYRAFHGREPDPGWREATPQDIQRAAGGERPHIVFLSAPCKGFSGLLSETLSKTEKYQALNRLTLRGVWLMLEAWANDPPELVLFENVPRLATRGRALLDRITAMLRAYGYATAETTHDCGELGGLAQSRKRFLLVARHLAKVPPLLYQPDRRPLRAVGDVLGQLPLPGSGHVMHRLPSLQWKTWVRLAFVEAGSDWRSLNKLAIEDGHLRDFILVPRLHNGAYGVRQWDGHCGTVAGDSLPSNGAFSIADPRFAQSDKWSDGQAYGVRRWCDSTGAVTSQTMPGQGAHSVADPRQVGTPKHNNEYRVVRWDRAAQAVTGAHGSGQCVADPRSTATGRLFTKYPVTDWTDSTGTVIGGDDTGAYAVADPRPTWDRHGNNLAVESWNEPARTVIAGGKGVQGGWLSVADPRSGMAGDRAAYLTGGHYGVVPWDRPAGAVSGAACHDNGPWSVADPRPMPAPDEKLVCRIEAIDGTWHRPFTTLELARLQSLFDPEDPEDIAAFGLDGSSDGAWRERVGNAVPCDAATAIASEMGRTLLLAWSGESFQLSATPIWVRPVAAGLSVAQGGAA